MRVLFTLIWKEVTQFRRNKFLPRLVLAFPVMVMLVFPWVTTMDVRHVAVSVVDQDGSPLSERIISKLAHSEYFSLEGVSQDYGRELEELENNRIDVILSIPEGFEAALVGGSPKKVSLSANAVNAVKGSLGSQYLAGTVASAQKEFFRERGLPVPQEKISIRNLYNPTMEYRNFMIPAILIILLLLVCGFLPALNIVTEKENGTFEQINVTPVNPFVFTLAKLIPYWVIGFVVIGIAMLVAWAVYGLVPLGSLGAIALGAFLYILAMSAFGVSAANITDTMIQTVFVMFFFVMLFMLMGGILTPLTSMPQWAQTFALAFPPRYFAEIVRAVYLKGATIGDLSTLYWGQAALAGVFTGLAALSYRKRR